jgi:hypothetical protein
MPDPLPVSCVNHMHLFVRGFNNRRIIELAIRLVFEFGDIVPVNTIPAISEPAFNSTRVEAWH